MKTLFLVLFLSCTAFYASAQHPGNHQDIENYKIDYLKEKLELTPAEQKVFWPIYNSWQAEQQVLRKARRGKMISFRKITDIEAMSDTEVQQLIQNELSLKQRDLDIEKKYYQKLKSNLPIKTVGKYYRAQETFKRELLSRFRNGQQKP